MSPNLPKGDNVIVMANRGSNGGGEGEGEWAIYIGEQGRCVGGRDRHARGDRTRRLHSGTGIDVFGTQERMSPIVTNKPSPYT